MRVELPYVKSERDRQGCVRYWYFRRNGRRWRLPDVPFSEEFLAEYNRLKDATEPHRKAPSSVAVKAPPGSFKALVMDYMASAEFRDRKPATRSIYRTVLDPLIEQHGHKPAALIERRHVKAWRDAKAETPAMANMVVKVMKMLLTFAMDNEYRRDNPATKLTLFRLGEHRAWTESELAAFEAHWPPGTMQRRAYMLARYTGQRCGDVAAMTRAARGGGAIRVRQQKTSKVLLIPEHRALAEELALGDQAHMSLLVRTNGKAFDGESLSPWFGTAIETAGLPDACVMHGLRKVAARDLAEAGCTAHEIASITGQSLAEIERYTRAVEQKQLATAAILKLEQNKKRTEPGNRPKQSMANDDAAR